MGRGKGTEARATVGAESRVQQGGTPSPPPMGAYPSPAAPYPQTFLCDSLGGHAPQSGDLCLGVDSKS